MNITFFIGNGFDLNLGLKTRYENFYEYFQMNSNEDNMIKGWINKKESLWSDLEEALGKSLSKIKENEEFCNGFIKTQMNKLIGKQKTKSNLRSRSH